MTINTDNPNSTKQSRFSEKEAQIPVGQSHPTDFNIVKIGNTFLSGSPFVLDLSTPQTKDQQPTSKATPALSPTPAIERPSLESLPPGSPKFKLSSLNDYDRPIGIEPELVDKATPCPSKQDGKFLPKETSKPIVSPTEHKALQNTALQQEEANLDQLPLIRSTDYIALPRPITDGVSDPIASPLPLESGISIIALRSGPMSPSSDPLPNEMASPPSLVSEISISTLSSRTNVMSPLPGELMDEAVTPGPVELDHPQVSRMPAAVSRLNRNDFDPPSNPPVRYKIKKTGEEVFSKLFSSKDFYPPEDPIFRITAHLYESEMSSYHVFSPKDCDPPMPPILSKL